MRLKARETSCGAYMPHRRKPEKGSFGGHFDELVPHFEPNEAIGSRRRGAAERPREFQEKVDIHALLFERAWKFDGER